MTIQKLSECQPVRTLRVTVVEGPDKAVVCVADSEVINVGTAAGNQLTLSDEMVSRFHLELEGLDEGVQLVDHGSTNGTWLSSVRIERAIVPPGTVIGVGQSRLRIDDGDETFVELHADDRFGRLRGRSPAMRRMMARLHKAAQSDIGVLLMGESGTGKELIAEALHDQSGRAQRPFVIVDCGALAPGLVASELFGHERGAFTGADRQQAGAFERARGGTLFLDEIGELPPVLQTNLLGVLDRGRFRRVGGTEDIATDVRIVAATNRDLRAEVNAGKFRLDLYYRLAVVCVKVPPLRERRSDIPLLVEHFLRECGYSGRVGDVVPPDAMDELATHHWPGNVRELRNLIEARLAMGEALRAESVRTPSFGQQQPDQTPSPTVAPSLDLPYKQARAEVLRQFEAPYLRRLLEKAKGNVSEAARQAGMDRSHLTTLLRRHNLR